MANKTKECAQPMPGDMVLVRDDDDNRTPWKIRRYAFTFNDYVYCISKDGKIEEENVDVRRWNNSIPLPAELDKLLVENVKHKKAYDKTGLNIRDFMSEHNIEL